MDLTNYILPVIGAAILHFAIGSLWYSPVLFSKAWVKEMKFSEADMKKMRSKSMAKLSLVSIISSLVMAAVFSYMIDFAGLTLASEGALLGFLVWLGFIGSGSIGMILWEGRSIKHYLINNGYSLISYVIVGAVLVKAL